MAKVFIVNKSAHDFSKAKPYGELLFVTRGRLDRYNVNNMYRFAEEALKDSTPDDYILPCSLNTLNTIVCAVFAVKHSKLNLLLFKRGGYLERNLVF